MRDPNDNKTIDIEVTDAAMPMLKPGIAALETLVDTKQRAQVEFSELLGQIKAFEFQRKVSGIATLKIIAELKNSKAYRGLSLTSATGEIVVVQTWDDFCKAIGSSRQKIDDDLLSLETLGGDFLETARTMKLGHRDILKLRKLPEDERAIVMGNVEVSVGDKDSIVELINELAQKHAKEKATLEEQLEVAQKRVDVVVKEETKVLEKERAALIKERDELLDRLEEPGWKKAYEHALKLAEMVDEVERQVVRFTKSIPFATPVPTKLDMQVESAIFRAFHAAETAKDTWTNAQNDDHA